ncbi:MAG: hypothetical protein ABWY82_06275 [Tardiphaga sp.]
MDRLHGMLRAMRRETKSGDDHLTVFREFLARLDELQRAAAADKPLVKTPPRRKALRRVKG